MNTLRCSAIILGMLAVMGIAQEAVRSKAGPVDNPACSCKKESVK